MFTSLYRLFDHRWELHPFSQSMDESSANLVLCFASKGQLATPSIYETIRSKFSSAQIAMCSTAGEIYHDTVMDDSVVVAAIRFDKSTVKTCSVNISDFADTYSAAIALSRQLPKEQLVSVLILSDGSLVNGSELVKGVTTQLGNDVLITGGLAGDGNRFQSTLTGLNEQPKEGKIVAIGFYGNDLYVKHGSQGGWDIFGLEKRVTKSSGNMLVELEHQNALDIYKKYLGAAVEQLPGSALLFPLSVIMPGTDEPVVRTILAINEEEKTMTFAGDIPVGSKVRFMKANFERLTLAASEAAELTCIKDELPVFSLLVSCVGRKLVLKDKTAEEVQAVNRTFQQQTLLAGFYSYGELSPFNESGNCQLHNQTMTITSFYEH